MSQHTRLASLLAGIALAATASLGTAHAVTTDDPGTAPEVPAATEQAATPEQPAADQQQATQTPAASRAKGPQDARCSGFCWDPS